MIDFTNCEVIKSYTYEGANGKKIAIKYKGEIYMLKFPSKAKNNEKLSYSNSVISEFISCHIFEMIGFKTQETILGIYEVNGIKKNVVACKDFTVPNKKLHSFASIKNTVIDSESNGFGTELSDVLETINSQDIYNREKLTSFFWKMFIVDSLLGNFDRHNGNWGFLSQNEKFEIAPIFDCGSCLFPSADDDIMLNQLKNEEELLERVYTFPNSTLKIDGIKISPYKLITSLKNQNLNKALIKIFPKIDLKKINAFISSVEISEIKKEYYKKIIQERYNRILKKAYDELKSQEQ